MREKVGGYPVLGGFPVIYVNHQLHTHHLVIVLHFVTSDRRNR
jgi:hypothetical protein